MSFTLRNLFSEDDADPEANWSDGNPESGGRDTQPVRPPGESVEGTPYLVSELLPFIPPAIVASGDLPMEKEVFIPVMKEGSTDVTLSTIFRNCPELFDAEITPLNDSVVTLPRKEEKVSEETSGEMPAFEAPGTPFGAPGFGMSDVEEPGSTPEDNPFWSPETEAESKNGEAQELKGDTGFSNGFSSPSSPEVEPKEEEPASSDEEPFSGEKASKTVEEAMSGFEAPPSPKSSNPFGDPAASSGEDASGFSQNPFDSDESFTTLFSEKADEDKELPFPSSESDESTWGAMFEPESDGKAKEEADVPNEDAVRPEKDSVSASGEASAVANGFSSGDFPKDPFSAPATDPAPVPPSEKAPSSPSPAISFSVEKPSASKTPVPPAPEEKTFRPLREPTSSAGAPQVEVEEEKLAPVSSSMTGEMEVDLRDMEFRALFSSDDSFTLAKVAREVVAFEGVSACALATTAKLVQASRNEQSRLGDEAREMVDTIRNLAKLTGLPEARAFTLQTDRGTVSLFLEGDCCVTVNHDASGFGPGVREKLILVARSIHKLQE